MGKVPKSAEIPKYLNLFIVMSDTNLRDFQYCLVAGKVNTSILKFDTECLQK